MKNVLDHKNDFMRSYLSLTVRLHEIVFLPSFVIINGILSQASHKCRNRCTCMYISVHSIFAVVSNANDRIDKIVFDFVETRRIKNSYHVFCMMLMAVMNVYWLHSTVWFLVYIYIFGHAKGHNCGMVPVTFLQKIGQVFNFYFFISCEPHRNLCTQTTFIQGLWMPEIHKVDQTVRKKILLLTNTSLSIFTTFSPIQNSTESWEWASFERNIFIVSHYFPFGLHAQITIWIGF